MDRFRNFAQTFAELVQVYSARSEGGVLLDSDGDERIWYRVSLTAMTAHAFGVGLVRPTAGGRRVQFSDASGRQAMSS